MFLEWTPSYTDLILPRGAENAAFLIITSIVDFQMTFVATWREKYTQDKYLIVIYSTGGLICESNNE
jgi:hypothetical protein